MDKTRQRDWIVSQLRTGYGITPVEALQKCGCFRLAARILELRRDNVFGQYRIATEMVARGGKRFARYRLVK